MQTDHDSFAAWIAGLGVRVDLDLHLRGLRKLTDLRETLERVERDLVLGARRDRSTWAEIGDALGISRQSAYARHRPSVRSTDGDSPRRGG
jgi:hypothetical protein